MMPDDKQTAPLEFINDTIVEFDFENIMFEFPNFLNFDVLIRTNIDGLEFGEGELFTKYPASAFGSNVVTNEHIETLKGDVINGSQYALLTSDEEENTFKAQVNGGCVKPSLLQETVLPLSTEFQVFMKIKIEIQDLNAIGSISMDDILMAGKVFFFDPKNEECRPFTDVTVPNPFNIEDVCQCSFSTTNGNSWYVKGSLNYSDYQQDVYVFRLTTKQAYTGQLAPSIVDNISFHNETGLKYNTVYFSPLSTQQQREQIKDQIRNDSLFGLEFPAVTKSPAANHTQKKWMYTNDVINIVFHDPKPPQSDVQHIADRYNLTLIHKPKPTLPKGKNSWTYAYIINPTECKCRNAIDVSREIYQNDNSLVKIAEPWMEPSIEAGSTNDPYFPDSWHILNTGQCLGMSPAGSGTIDADCDIEGAWDMGFTGMGITVAVIDKSVFENNHPDISSKYINGYDYIDNDSDVTASSGPSSISKPHGQSCAGLIGATADNNIGIAGVSYDAQIVPIITWYGTSYLGFQHVCDPDVNADVVSCSWGWVGSPSEAVENDINLCKTLGRGGKGTIIVFSAGNGNSNTTSVFPAYLDDVIAVVASNPDDGRKNPGDGWSPWGSDYGPTVDVAAPGTHLVTTDLAGTEGYNNVNNGCSGASNLNNDYTYFNGTSSAAPIVAGASAVLLSANPNLTATQVQNILESTAEKVGGYDYNAVSSGRSLEMGYGRINLFDALPLVNSSEDISKSIFVKLYPNPAKDNVVLQLSLDKSDDISIALYDYMGNMVNMIFENQHFSNNEHSIPIKTGGLNNGLYLLVIKTKHSIQTLKLTVTR